MNAMAEGRMTVDAVAHGTTPFDWPSLVDQMSALEGTDPLLLGSSGSTAEMYSSRLAGDIA